MARGTDKSLDELLREKCPMEITDGKGRILGAVEIDEPSGQLRSVCYSAKFVKAPPHDLVTDNLNEAVMHAACGRQFGVPAA